MSKDRLLGDEELRKELAVIAQNTPAEFQVYTILAEEIAKRMLSLINTQKRLYAESVLMPIKNIYMQADYEGTDDDMIQEIIRATEDGLRAEQRAMIK